MSYLQTGLVVGFDVYKKNVQSVKDKAGLKAGHTVDFGGKGQRDKKDRGQQWFKQNNKKIIEDQYRRLKG